MKRKKKRSREEMLDVVNIAVAMWKHDEKYHIQKTINHYRNYTGILMSNELYEDLFKGIISSEEFLEKANEYRNGNPEKKKAIAAKKEIAGLLTRIGEIVSDNSKYMSLDVQPITNDEPRLFSSNKLTDRAIKKIRYSIVYNI